MPLASVSPVNFAVHLSVMPLLVAEVLPDPVKSELSGMRCQAKAGVTPATPNARPAMIARAVFMTYIPGCWALRRPVAERRHPPVEESLRSGDRGNSGVKGFHPSSSSTSERFCYPYSEQARIGDEDIGRQRGVVAVQECAGDGGGVEQILDVQHDVPPVRV